MLAKPSQFSDRNTKLLAGGRSASVEDVGRRVSPLYAGEHKPEGSKERKLSIPAATRSTNCCRATSEQQLKKAGPSDPPPSYEVLDSLWANKLIMKRFRSKLVQHLGEDSPLSG